MTPQGYYRALLSKDVRFDGKFFFGVRTTGIYCRPICSSRKPHFQNVIFFKEAAQAQESGFRPCKRCRPESTPGTSAWVGKSATLTRALKLIKRGVYDREGILGLAQKLGIGDRHLRRLFNNKYQKSPRETALESRLETAKKLIKDNSLPITDVAILSGFKSVRRFNDAFKRQFKSTPSQVRKDHK